MIYATNAHVIQLQPVQLLVLVVVLELVVAVAVVVVLRSLGP